jgi:hypothetical protein
MKRAFILAALVVLVAAAAGSGTGAAAACKPGAHKVGKVIYRTYCGPASASVKVAGKIYTFRNGSCLRAGITRVFAMSIGKLTSRQGKPRYSYFGVTVPSAKHDGVYRRAVITWSIGGKRYSLSNVKLRLTNKQTRGSFSGRAVDGRGKVTGSFRCK